MAPCCVGRVILVGTHVRPEIQGGKPPAKPPANPPAKSGVIRGPWSRQLQLFLHQRAHLILWPDKFSFSALFCIVPLITTGPFSFDLDPAAAHALCRPEWPAGSTLRISMRALQEVSRPFCRQQPPKHDGQGALSASKIDDVMSL
jgi:hypothetical protein